MVVVAHPKQDSITQDPGPGGGVPPWGGVAAGHKPTLELDLCAIGRIGAHPGPGGPRGPISTAGDPSLVRAHPVWRGAPPAILQGWQQRVMTQAFDAGAGVGWLVSGMITRCRARVFGAQPID